jgi:hypothetical protein
MPVRSSIHTIKVSLRYVNPPIWRRLQVPSTTSLAELHDIIQTAMGWYDCHLHQFEVNGVHYADTEHMLEDTTDEARRTLAAMQAGDRLAYWYDFGDDWWHDIVVESVDRADPALTYPHCVTGRRAGPPEDSGGPWGFAELMRALGDANHPEHDVYCDWMEQVGEVGYRPERFDLDAINEALARLSAVALQR